jgi:hypothetical protein
LHQYCPNSLITINSLYNKCLGKFGKANTGAEVSACFNASKAVVWSAVQIKQVCFLRRSVKGLCWECGSVATKIPTPELTSQGNSSEPLPMTTSAIHLHIFYRRQLIARRSLGPHGIEAKLDRAEDTRRKGRLCRRPPPHWRPQGREGSRRRSPVRRRSLYLATWRSGHVSCSHSWGTEIFVNYKGL